MGGLQDNRVVACGKHFPVMATPTLTRTRSCPIVTAPRERLEHIEFPPFRRAVANGVATMMTAHVLYQALDEKRPATLSPTIIGRFLREELHYDGVVLTDDLEMHAIIDHYGIGDATIQAIQAGCDMPLICKDRNRVVAAMTAVDKAVADGDISTGRLAQSLARIRRVKERFLLPYRPVMISDCQTCGGVPKPQGALALHRPDTRTSRESRPITFAFFFTTYI